MRVFSYNFEGHTSTLEEFKRILQKYYPQAEVEFDAAAPYWPYPPKVDGSRLEKQIGLQIKNPEQGS